MRFMFATTKHALNVSKALKKILENRGSPRKLGECREVVARMFGYADWHELHKSAEASSGESLYDDQMNPEQLEHWKQLLIIRMSAALTLSEEEIVAILPELRPLQRTRYAKEPDFKRKIAEKAASNGFVVLSDDDRLQKMYETLLGEKSDRGITRRTLSFEGKNYTVLLIKRLNKELEQRYLASILDFSAYIGDGKNVLGAIKGSMVTAKAELEFGDFFSVCDEDSDELSNLCYLWGQQGHEHWESCRKGARTIFVPYWERSHKFAPKGLGKPFFVLVSKNLLGSSKKPSVCVFLNDPPQYKELSVNTKLSLPQYRAAQDNLARCLWEASLHFEVSGCVTQEGMVHADVEQETLFRAGKIYAQQHDDGEYEAFTSHSGLSNTLESMFEAMLLAEIDNATVDDPSEPKGLALTQWPKTFEWRVASTFLSFKPHPELWKYMPSDIWQIELPYVRPLEFKRRGEGSILPAINFYFENGSVLNLDTNHLVPGDWAIIPPKQVKDPRFDYLLQNPFTNRYSTATLIDTLRINALLLFDGAATASEPIWPLNTVVVKRPGR